MHHAGRKLAFLTSSLTSLEEHFLLSSLHASFETYCALAFYLFSLPLCKIEINRCLLTLLASFCFEKTLRIYGNRTSHELLEIEIRIVGKNKPRNWFLTNQEDAFGNILKFKLRKLESASANKSIPPAFQKFQSWQYVAVRDNADYC